MVRTYPIKLRIYRYHFMYLGILATVALRVTAQPTVTVHPKWSSTANLAQQRQDVGELAASEASWRQALQEAEGAPERDDGYIAVLLSNLAAVIHSEGRDREAYPLASRAAEIGETTHDLQIIALAQARLGLILQGEGEYARAEPALRRSLALFEKSEGGNSLHAAVGANNLAMLYLDTGRFGIAEQAERRALPIYEKLAGADDASFSAALANLYAILASQHRADEGAPYLARALAIAEKLPNEAAMAHLRACQASLAFIRGQVEEAARILLEVISTQARILGKNHPEVAQSLLCYSMVLRRLHRNAESEASKRRAQLIQTYRSSSASAQRQGSQ